jgi:hypothetical protein
MVTTFKSPFHQMMLTIALATWFWVTLSSCFGESVPLQGELLP